MSISLEEKKQVLIKNADFWLGITLKRHPWQEDFYRLLGEDWVSIKEVLQAHTKKKGIFTRMHEWIWGEP